jgi:hypothetical protein
MGKLMITEPFAAVIDGIKVKPERYPEGRKWQREFS